MTKYLKQAQKYITKAKKIDPKKGAREQFIRSEHLKHAINEIQHEIDKNNKQGDKNV